MIIADNVIRTLKTMKYRVKRFSCFHAGKEYKVGEFLPESLSPEELNVHLPNLEVVETSQPLPNLFGQWIKT